MTTSKKKHIWNIFYENGRDIPLEHRLLQFYMLSVEIWGIFNTIMSFVFDYPETSKKMYVCFIIYMTVQIFALYISRRNRHVINLFFIIMLITNPIVWFCAGGNDASANVLFVNEAIAFVMCMKGIKQKVYVILSLVSSTVVYVLMGAIPSVRPVAMTAIQKSNASRNIGMSTTILIVALLLKQKKEYVRERDVAINSEKELERSNQMQKNFLANMSHEIRSPLGIVMGFNGLIAESNDIDQVHEYSTNIDKAGKTLHTVINDILDYSKIESGKLDIIDCDYSYDELISEVKNDIGLKCSEKGLKFIIEDDSNIPGYLYGDNIRIKQCLLNILSNAVKYTDSGSVLLKIRLMESQREGYCKISFAVSDTGRGMKPETIPELFNAFQRLDEGQNRGIEGTGLGLAITKNLLDEMGGTIDVISAYGVGSTFTIALEQKVSDKQREKKVVAVDEVNLAGLKILAVDDTKLNLSLIQKLLVKKEIIVKTIDNGQDCLEDCAKNKYDMILLDHMMPEMDGVEVFKRLRQEDGLNKDTPVIMLTANAMAGAGKDYSDLGFDGYVSKPIAPNMLYEAIGNLVGR